MNKENSQKKTFLNAAPTSDTNSQKKMAMIKGGDTERTVEKIREKDENEADERKIGLGKPGVRSSGPVVSKSNTFVKT